MLVGRTCDRGRSASSRHAACCSAAVAHPRAATRCRRAAAPELRLACHSTHALRLHLVLQLGKQREACNSKSKY